jgi:transposase
MRLYGAIDLHSNNNVTVISDEEDRVVFNRRLPNDLPTVLRAVEPYRADLQGLAVESTFNWYWLVDGLMEAGYKVHLVNTNAVKTYDGLKFTDDEDDARHLAHLLRLGILPTGYIYPKELRAVRDLARKRLQLVRQRTIQILSLENLAQRNAGKILSQRQAESLDESAIQALCGGDPHRALAMKSSLVVARCLSEQILALEKVILSQVKLRPEFKKLLTVDGIGPIMGLTIMLETGDIRRFKTVGHYASYCRCVDSRKLSNAKKKGEGNRKNGNKYLAWAYIEAAEYARRWNERVRRFFDRKKAKTMGVIARKAIAHKLARACFFVMRDQVDFDASRAFA